MKTERSEVLFSLAQKTIPGGVNSPVRAFGAVGGTPLFFDTAKGAYLYDVDGNRYIDYVGSWGPMIVGHGHPDVIAAVEVALHKAMSFGAPCELEVLLAQEVCQRIPSVEKIRMLNSGTEATMTAIRLARGITRRNKIIKFEGCYHGHADSLLVKAGSGALTLGMPNSPGVPAALAAETLVATFNDLDSVSSLCERYQNEIAAIIVEPVAGNMNMVLPEPGFLQGLRQLCDLQGIVFIIDEVMTGFRIHPQGAQGLYGVSADLTTFGKIIGGGMPVGALGGRADMMSQLAPEGPVYQAGTLSGNPVAMAAGLATLKLLTQEAYAYLEQTTAYFAEALQQIAQVNGVNLVVNYLPGMFGFFFSKEATISRYSQVLACDQTYFAKFFRRCLDRGVYFAPSAFESGFISLAHTQADIDATLAVIGDAFAQ